MSLSTTAQTSPIGSWKAWCLVGFMWVAFYLNYCDRQVVFSIFPSLEKDLQFTPEQKGLTGSIFLWIYGLCSPFAGRLGDRFSRRQLVVWSLVLWSLATLLTAYSRSPEMLLTLRGIIGVSEALFYPAALTLTAAAHPPETRSKAIAFFASAQIAGTVSGGWFGGYMADHVQWRQAFFQLGLIGLAFALPYALFLKSVPTLSEPKKETHTESFSFADFFKIPTYLILCFCFSAYVMVLWLLNSWLSNFFVEKFKMSMERSSVNATVWIQVPTLVGIILGGILADMCYRRNRAARFWLVGLSILVCAPALYFIGHAPTFESVRIAQIVFGLASGFFIANAMASSFDVVPVQARATGVGILNLVGGFAAGFGPWLVGKLKTTIPFAHFLTFFAVLGVVAGILVLLAIYFTFDRDHARAEQSGSRG